MKLGQWLAREGIPQKVFAGRIGRSVASVSRLANDLQRPDLQTILNIERETAGAVSAIDFADAAPREPDAKPSLSDDLQATG